MTGHDSTPIFRRIVTIVTAVLLVTSVWAVVPALAADVSISQSVSSASVSPGTTVEVSVTLDASGLDSPAIDLTLPAGWEVVAHTDDDGTYRDSERQWVWTTGGVKEVTYSVQVPSNASGTYTLLAEGSAIDASGSFVTDTSEQTITVGEANSSPEATVDAPATATVDETVTFNASGSTDPDGDALTYEWDFNGDGVSNATDQSLAEGDARGVSAARTFSSTGTYTITVIVTDEHGKTDTHNHTITVSAPVTEEGGDEFADGEYADSWNVTERDDETIRESDGVLLHDSPTNYNAGGSLLSRTQYAADGTVTVAVRQRQVENPFWGAGFDLVFENTSVRLKEHKWGLNDRLVLKVDGEAHRLDSATDSTEWTTYSVTLDFESGVITSVTRGGETYAVNVSLPDRDDDSFRLKIGGGRGHRTLYEYVRVERGPSNAAPMASFTYAPSSPTVSETVTFNASGSTDPDGDALTYEWDFDGDGTAETSGKTVTHAFTEAANYTVTLTVTDEHGAAGTGTATITVTPTAETGFITGLVTDTTGTVVANATVAVLAERDVVERTTTSKEGEYTVEVAPGNYTVQATKPGFETGTTTVAVKAGTTSTANIVLRANESSNSEPTASFAYAPSSPTVGETVTFDASGSSDPDGDALTYEWDFDGDGDIDAEGEAVTETFENSGDHPVTLTVTDEDGATDTVTRTVTTVDEKSTVKVVLTDAPSGLRKYNVTVSGQAEILNVTPKLITGDAFQISAGGEGAPSVTARAVDIRTSVGNFTESRVLFTVTVAGRIQPDEVAVTVHTLTDDTGATIDTRPVKVRVERPTPFEAPIGGGQGPPKDLDGDGLFADVNGDGKATFRDAVTLAFVDFAGLRPAQVDALDFNGDGEVNFDDAIALAFR